MVERGAGPPAEVDRHVGGRIRARRVGAGLPPGELASRAGLDQDLLLAYEEGLRTVPGEHLFAIARALDVPASWFFEGLAAGAAATPPRRTRRTPRDVPLRVAALGRAAPPPPASRPLQGLRLLLVEDDSAFAAYLSSLFSGRGCAVLGPAHDVESALDLMEREGPAAALLDANLGGRLSGPVARALGARGAPFLVLTGYEELVAEDPVLSLAPRLRKPVDTATLLRAVEGLRG